MLTRMRRLMTVAVGIAVVSVAAIGLLAVQSTATAQTGTASSDPEFGGGEGSRFPFPFERPVITISVQNLNTSTPIRDNSTVPPSTPFQVRVTTDGVDCAGQFVVTALGAPGAPPSVLVTFNSFIVGPFVGTNSAVGQPLVAAVKPDGSNAFKISATCNGAKPGQFAVDRFEFFVRAD